MRPPVCVCVCEFIIASKQLRQDLGYTYVDMGGKEIQSCRPTRRLASTPRKTYIRLVLDNIQDWFGALRVLAWMGSQLDSSNYIHLF